MSSTAVIERPIFKSGEYLRELVRRNRRRAEDAGALPNDPPPMPPESAFILPDDEAIACEVDA